MLSNRKNISQKKNLWELLKSLGNCQQILKSIMNVLGIKSKRLKK